MSLSIARSSAKPTIINFAVAGVPRARNAKLPDHPDAELIQACLNYAIAMRGASGAYEADPTGDNDFAAAADTRLLKQAAKEQDVIAASHATTLDGLRAKAAAADIAANLDRDCAPSFLRSLAADVIRIHRATKEPTDRKVTP